LVRVRGVKYFFAWSSLQLRLLLKSPFQQANF
jgi:hypothetical protein